MVDIGKLLFSRALLQRAKDEAAKVALAGGLDETHSTPARAISGVVNPLGGAFKLKALLDADQTASTVNSGALNAALGEYINAPEPVKVAVRAAAQGTGLYPLLAAAENIPGMREANLRGNAAFHQTDSDLLDKLRAANEGAAQGNERGQGLLNMATDPMNLLGPAETAATKAGHPVIGALARGLNEAQALPFTAAGKVLVGARHPGLTARAIGTGLERALLDPAGPTKRGGEAIADITRPLRQATGAAVDPFVASVKGAIQKGPVGKWTEKELAVFAADPRVQELTAQLAEWRAKPKTAGDQVNKKSGKWSNPRDRRIQDLSRQLSAARKDALKRAAEAGGPPQPPLYIPNETPIIPGEGVTSVPSTPPALPDNTATPDYTDRLSSLHDRYKLGLSPTIQSRLASGGTGALTGTAAGGAVGGLLPADTEEQRRENIRRGAIAGGVGFGALGLGVGGHEPGVDRIIPQLNAELLTGRYNPPPQPKATGTLEEQADAYLQAGMNRFFHAPGVPGGQYSPDHLKPPKNALSGFLKRVRQVLGAQGESLPDVTTLSKAQNWQQGVDALEQNEQLAHALGLDDVRTSDDFYELVALRAGNPNAAGALPTMALQAKQDPYALATFFDRVRRERPGVLDAADKGIEEIRTLMLPVRQAGTLDVRTVMKSWLWTMFSNNSPPFGHEGNFMMAMGHYLEPLLERASRGFKDEAELQRWLGTDVESFVRWSGNRQGYVTPGERAISLGREVPERVAQMPYQLRRAMETLGRWSGVGENAGRGPLHGWTELLNQPDQYTGRQLRREFYRLGMGKGGVDNKLLSFNLLLMGEKDVFVFDIIQSRNVHEAGFQQVVARALGNKSPISSDSVIAGMAGGTESSKKLLTEATNAVVDQYGGQLPGLINYEVTEDLFRTAATVALGEPDLAKLHWYLWNTRDWRAVEHASLGPALQASIGGLAQPGQGYGNLPPMRVDVTTEGLPLKKALGYYLFPDRAEVDTTVHAKEAGALMVRDYSPGYFDEVYNTIVAKLEKIVAPRPPRLSKKGELLKNQPKQEAPERIAAAQEALDALRQFSPDKRDQWNTPATEAAREEFLSYHFGSPDKKTKRVPILGDPQTPEKVMGANPLLGPQWTEDYSGLTKSREVLPGSLDPRATLGQVTSQHTLGMRVKQADPGEYTYGTVFRQGQLPYEELRKRVGTWPVELGYPGAEFNLLPLEEQVALVRKWVGFLQDPSSGLREALSGLGLRVEFNPSLGSDAQDALAPNIVFLAGAFDNTTMLSRDHLAALLDGVAALASKELKQRSYVWSVPATAQEAALRLADPEAAGNQGINYAVNVLLPRGTDLAAFRAALDPDLGFTRLPTGELQVLNFTGMSDEDFTLVMKRLVDQLTGGRGIINQETIFGNYVDNIANPGAYDQHILALERLLQGGEIDYGSQAYNRGLRGQPSTGAGVTGLDSRGTGVVPPGAAGNAGAQAGRTAALKQLRDVFSAVRDGLDTEVQQRSAANGSSPATGIVPGLSSSSLGLTQLGALPRSGAARAVFPVAGAIAGGTLGAMTGDNPEDARRNALTGATIGAGVGAGFEFSPQIISAIQRNVSAPGTVLDPDIITAWVDKAWEDMVNSGQVPAASSGAEKLRAAKAQWSAQVVHTLKQLPQDSLTRLVTMKGIAEQEFGITGDLIRRWQSTLTDQRARGIAVPDPVATWFHDLGRTDLFQQNDQLVGLEHGNALAGDYAGKKLSGAGRAVMGGIFSGANGRPTVNPLAIAYGTVRGYVAPFVDTLIGGLNGIQHDSFRLAMQQKSLDTYIPQVADLFLQELATKGYNVAPLQGRGGRFDRNAVEAVAPGAGQVWDDLVEGVVRSEGDRIAFLAGDFRDKLAKGYKGRVTPIDRAVSTVERGLRPFVPFARWQIRYTPVLAEIALRHPGSAAIVLALMNRAANASGDKLRSYEKGTVAIDTETPLVGGLARTRLGGARGEIRFNPLQAISPYDASNLSPDPLPPDATFYQNAKQRLGQLGGQFNPLVQTAAYITGQDYAAPGALSRTAGLEGLGDLGQLGGMPMLPSVTAGVGVARDMVTGQSNGLTDPTYRRYAELVLAQTGIPLGDIRNRGYMETVAAPDNPLWQQALFETRLGGAAGNAVGMVSPLTVTGSTREAVAARGAQPLPFSNYQISQASRAEAAQMLLANARAMQQDPASGTYTGVNKRERHDILMREWDRVHNMSGKQSAAYLAQKRKEYERSLR